MANDDIFHYGSPTAYSKSSTGTTVISTCPSCGNTAERILYASEIY
jgi:hypothetical protein